MFRKFFIFALCATACGYVFASDTPCNNQPVMQNSGAVAPCAAQPVWPTPGSDADVQYYPNNENGMENYDDNVQNVRIVSKIGTDLVVENNFNLGGAGRNVGEGWSGGADLTHPYQAPAGFNIFESQAEMPLMHTEMMEDDGGSVLAISRSGKQKAKTLETGKGIIIEDKDFSAENPSDFEVEESTSDVSSSSEINMSAQDQVRSWVVASGQTLRGVLQEWCDKEGWDLVWNTSREYPIQASAVFKGRFMDVASALVRNFSRANPIPYAKFFKGNRVLVITTTEE